MEVTFIPQWFATPDGASTYALSSPDRLVEHQRVGGRYMRHVLEVKTYPDRLYVSALLDRLASGALVSLEEVDYAERVRNIEQLERIG